MFQTIYNLKDFKKTFIVRSGLDVQIDQRGHLEDDFRIAKSLPTLQYLLERGAKVVIISHRGRPQGYDKKFTLEPLAKILSRLLARPVTFLPEALADSTRARIAKARPGEVFLLENIRFYDGEQNNHPDFARKLAELGQVFVNDAFSDCHRSHASIVGLAKHLPSLAGLLLTKEAQVLSKIITQPWRPLITVMGGAKFETRVRFVEQFLNMADHVLLGGVLANVILRVKGMAAAKPLIATELLKIAEQLPLTNPKLHLPIDVVVSSDLAGDNYTRVTAPGSARHDELVLDIGPETSRFFGDIIFQAKMIIFSGPLGLYENKKFETGTRSVLDHIARNHHSFKVAGGNNTIAVIRKFGFEKSFDFLSTGGGAMLQFLAGKEMPGLEALK